MLALPLPLPALGVQERCPLYSCLKTLHPVRPPHCSHHQTEHEPPSKPWPNAVVLSLCLYFRHTQPHGKEEDIFPGTFRLVKQSSPKCSPHSESTPVTQVSPCLLTVCTCLDWALPGLCTVLCLLSSPLQSVPNGGSDHFVELKEHMEHKRNLISHC